MRVFSLTVLALLFLPFLIYAQNLPTIDSFTVDNTALDYAEVERGIASANFSWQASGLRSGDSMEMHAWVNGDWALIGEGFEPIKTDSLVIAHPLSFELPRYRLSIVDSAGQRIAENILELHYAEAGNRPFIQYFASRAYGFSSNVIRDNLGVVMHWSVSNRWYRSNIYFEQLMADGSVIQIAENTPDEWRRATDEGTLFPRFPGEGINVVLRLRVANIDTGETLASYDTMLPITHDEGPDAELIRFTVNPTVGRLNGTVTLSWEVANASRVFIGQRVPLRSNVGMCTKNGGYRNETIYEDLPTTGSLEIQIPEEAYGAIRFQIVADYYYVGQYSCEPSPLLGEIFLELEDYSLYSPILQSFEFTTTTDAVAGDSFPISWSAREGQSIMIVQTSGYSSFSYESSEGVEVFNNLPLTGSMTIQVPNTIEIRQEPQFSVYLFLNRDDGTQPELLWSQNFRIDRDDNLACDSFIEVGAESAAPSSEVELRWDSCGTDAVRLEILSYVYDTSEFRDLGLAGTEQLILPDRTGYLVFVLHRLRDGELIELGRTGLLIE